jgi:sec-independent protein translocase protein TatA
MHVLFILVIALIFFGPGKLSELGEGLGRGIREFKKAMADGAKEAGEAKEASKELAK